MTKTIAALFLLSGALVLVSCSTSEQTGPVRFVASDRTLGASDLATGVDGYVYIPASPSSVGLAVSDVVFAQTADAPAGTVPAVGVAVTAATAQAAAAQATTTDDAGHFAVDVADTGDSLTLTLGFANADPEWSRTELGELTGAAPDDVVRRAGLTSATKDLASSGLANEVGTVLSFTGQIVGSSSSDQPVVLDVWLSRTEGQDGSALIDGAGDPVMADLATRTYHMWQTPLPAGADHQTVPVTWDNVDNHDAAVSILNPHTDQEPAGSKRVTLYCMARPSGEGVTLHSMTVDMAIVAAQAVGATAARAGTVQVRFLGEP